MTYILRFSDFLYILKTVWWGNVILGIMDQCNTNINPIEYMWISDLYFMVQLFWFINTFKTIWWRNVIFGIMDQYGTKIDLIKYRRGLLPVGWQETFRSAASRLAQTQKSPASRLAADLKVSCQPATITYQIKYFIGIYVQLCLKSSHPTLIFKSFLFLIWICWAVLKPIQVLTVSTLSFSNGLMG